MSTVQPSDRSASCSSTKASSSKGRAIPPRVWTAGDKEARTLAVWASARRRKDDPRSRSQEDCVMGYLIPVQELLWQIKRHPEQMASILLWVYAGCALGLVLRGTVVFT